MSNCFIYAIHHPVSLHVYVGKTAKGIKRPQNHGSSNNMKKHSHLPVVRWIGKLRRQGLDYEIVILEEHENEKTLNDAEKFYIAYFGSIGMSLLNLTEGGDGGTQSPEVREKISKKLKGRKIPAEVVAKVAASLTGKKRSLEARANMSVAQKGRSVSPEQRQKISKKLTGTKHSPDVVAKRTASNTGKKRSPETIAVLVEAQNRPEVKAKMVAALTGRVITWGDKISAALNQPEVKAKMVAASTGRKITWADKISASLTGKKASAEAKANMSVAAKKRAPDHYVKMVASRRAKQVPRIRINLLGDA